MIGLQEIALNNCQIDYHTGQHSQEERHSHTLELQNEGFALPLREEQEQEDDALAVFKTQDSALELTGNVMFGCKHQEYEKLSYFALEVVCTAKEDLWLDNSLIELAHKYEPDERILLNGYQSWTDTVELSPRDRMRGLWGVPKYLITKYALDGGGDYRFYEYSYERGKLHGYTYATLRFEDVGRAGAEQVVLIASLDENTGFTRIQTNTKAQKAVLNKECPQRCIQAGEECLLGRFLVVRAGSREAAYDFWFDMSGIKPRKAPLTIGYTSWYRHYENIEEAKVLADLKSVAHVLEDMDANPRLAKLFQIDDGYTKVGDWLNVNTQKFPHGLQPIAQEIISYGFVPGLWVAPFICETNSDLAIQHPDWLLREANGNTVTTGPQWSGGLALDTLNPQVRSYITQVLHTMTHEWGFMLLKCDFLFAACMLAHGGLNRGELMANAMDLIRDAVGDDVAILACGVPLASVFGKAEYCRIGCDVGLDWNDKFFMRLLHRERVSTKNSLANTYFRAPLNGRAFANDPDVFFLREDVKLIPQQRWALLEAAVAQGGILLTSDNMDSWTPLARGYYRAALLTFAQKATE
ncbi:MAG: alpha-galactosidase [Coriobacteriales bacterium]|nr:alpha-galactosidase [Coriobacteriales bacterium]